MSSREVARHRLRRARVRSPPPRASGRTPSSSNHANTASSLAGHAADALALPHARAAASRALPTGVVYDAVLDGGRGTREPSPRFGPLTRPSSAWRGSGAISEPGRESRRRRRDPRASTDARDSARRPRATIGAPTRRVRREFAAAGPRRDAPASDWRRRASGRQAPRANSRSTASARRAGARSGRVQGGLPRRVARPAGSCRSTAARPTRFARFGQTPVAAGWSTVRRRAGHGILLGRGSDAQAEARRHVLPGLGGVR